MLFWGVEVKGEQPLVVEPDGDMILHLSQACLSEIKKDKGGVDVYLYAKFGDRKHVLGILSSDKCPQISLDLVFEKKFELSHNWKNGSVHFIGYQAQIANESDESDDGSDSEDIMPLNPVGPVKPNVPEKSEVKIEEPSKFLKSDDEQAKVQGEEESSEEDTEDEDDSEDDETDDGEDEDEDEDEEIPNKADTGKKRPAESASKTPAPGKKAKVLTPPQTTVIKTGSKKAGDHTATPHPAKQAGKKAANSDQAKRQTPKSAGAFSCKSCNRSFNSENALQSHNKDKHGAAK